jgi:hypothetical protein
VRRWVAVEPALEGGAVSAAMVEARDGHVSAVSISEPKVTGSDAPH